MPTILPIDSNNNPIPALRFRDGGAQKITATSTAARNSTAFDPDTKVVSLYATVAVYVRFGGSSVVATTSDHYFPAGVYYDVAIAANETAQTNYISVLRADSSDGVLYLSEKI